MGFFNVFLIFFEICIKEFFVNKWWFVCIIKMLMLGKVIFFFRMVVDIRIDNLLFWKFCINFNLDVFLFEIKLIFFIGKVCFKILVNIWFFEIWGKNNNKGYFVCCCLFINWYNLGGSFCVCKFFWILFI